MLRKEILVRSAVAFLLAALLTGCGGLEKGPAPDLPYTPEPPRPRPEPKFGMPKTLGPSTPVPIKIEPPVKKDAAPEKAEPGKESGTKDPAPVKDGEEKAPAGEKDAPAKDTTPTKKDGSEPKKD